MNINEVHWNFQIMEPRNQLKADFETSTTFEPLGIFDAVFTVVLRRMSSIILYVCLYLHWDLFIRIRNSSAVSVTQTKFTVGNLISLCNVVFHWLMSGLVLIRHLILLPS